MEEGRAQSHLQALTSHLAWGNRTLVYFLTLLDLIFPTPSYFSALPFASSHSPLFLKVDFFSIHKASVADGSNDSNAADKWLPLAVIESSKCSIRPLTALGGRVWRQPQSPGAVGWAERRSSCKDLVLPTWSAAPAGAETDPCVT